MWDDSTSFGWRTAVIDQENASGVWMSLDDRTPKWRGETCENESGLAIRPPVQLSCRTTNRGE